MPTKQKSKAYHKGHAKEKHTKRFIKAYAPYLPLVAIIATGMMLSFQHNLHQVRGSVLAYATSMTDPGLLDATNQERVKNGLTPLNFDTELDQAAQNKAQDMADRNYWAHNTPEGKEPWVFIEQTGYRYFKAAENLAYGFDTSDTTVAGWMNSPTHRANILDPDLRDVGFGIVNVADYQGRGAQTIVVAMYGLASPDVVASAPANSPPNIVVATSNDPQKISYAQALTGGTLPWASFAVGIIIGLSLMYLIGKHTHGLHRVLRKGEQFIVRHPLLDITLVALVVLAAVLSQTAGFIQ